jgi:toxin ParE1/3/4
MGYHLSAPAIGDLADAWAYIAAEGSEARADRVVDALFEKFELLAAFPSLGRSSPQFGAEVRSLPVGAYIVYYRPVDGDALLIARVLHGRRDQVVAWNQR